MIKSNNKQNRRERVWCYGAGKASQSWEQFLAWTFSGHIATLKWRESPRGPHVVFNHNKAQKKNTEHYFMACKTVDDHTLLHF